MPKKKVISMLEFLRTGSFGEITCGVEVTAARKYLGKPIYVKESEYATEKWVYEDIDFYINQELQKIWGIMIWGFRAKDEYGNHPRENKKFQIDPWKLRWQLGFTQTLLALDSVNLNYQHLENTPKGYETIQFRD